VQNLPGERPQHHLQSDPRLDLRVSHDDRERVVERLRQAAGEGRLDIDELEERLERAFAAKTYRDLQPLLADLPGRHGSAPRPHPADADVFAPRPVHPVAPFSTALGGTPTVTRSQAVLGDQRRTGLWVVPTHYTASALLGSVLLDLREASFAEREVTISCTVFLGEVKIRVAPDVTVIDDATTTILGEAKQRTSRDLPPPPPGGPVLRVTGTVVLGEVTIERLAPGERRVRRRRRGHSTS
jgi:hypothetical protein